MEISRNENGHWQHLYSLFYEKKIEIKPAWRGTLRYQDELIAQ